MKKKHFSKKLDLKKQTVTNLGAIKGGHPEPTLNWTCDSCFIGCTLTCTCPEACTVNCPTNGTWCLSACQGEPYICKGEK